MKKITTKKILEEYGYLTANLKMIKKNNIPEIKKKFSFLHFNESYFSETYIKSDEKEFWKLIFFISKILTNAKAHLKTDIVEKCLQKNINFYLFAAEMCDDEGKMPDYILDCILEKYPQPKLLSHIFDCYLHIDADFSTFYVGLYSCVCAKCIVDAAIIADADGFPIDDDLIDKLSWNISKNEYDDEKSFDELLAELPDELTEGLPELISEFKELLNGKFPDDIPEFDWDNPSFLSGILEGDARGYEEDAMIESILEQREALLDDKSISAANKRRKLLEEVIAIDPEDIQIHFMLASEYKSFSKKMEICNRALEISKNIIGDEAEFSQLEKEQLFYLEPSTRPYMQTLFSIATICSSFGKHYKAAQIYWELLNLCPSDNLVVRTFYIETLLEIGNKKRTMYLLDKFPDDTLPSIVWSRILLLLDDNNIIEAKKEIKKAVNYNKNIPKYLLDKKKYDVYIYNPVNNGSKEEAERYCTRFKRFWSKETLKKLKKCYGNNS